MVLTYDAYEETLKEQEKQKMDMEKFGKMFERIEGLERRLQEKLK